MDTQRPFTITVHYDPCSVLPGQDPFQTWHERMLVQSWPDVEAVIDRILVREGMVIPGQAEGNRVWRFVPLHRIRGIEVVPGDPWNLRGEAKPSPPG